MALGFAHRPGFTELVQDTVLHVPTSWSLIDCAEAGSVKPIATTILRPNCFMISSTQVQSRAMGHAGSNRFFRCNCPPWAVPRGLSIHGLSATPDGGSGRIIPKRRG